MALFSLRWVPRGLYLLAPLLFFWAPAAAGQATLSAAQDTASLRLESLLRAVHASNPTLRAARIEADALATRPRQVSSLSDPQAGVSYRPFALGGLDGAAPAGISVSQMIPYPGKLRLAGEAARYGARMSSLQADELLLELEYQVRESYYELVRIQEQDRLIAGFQARLSDYEQAAASQYEVGTGAQQAILKAQLESTSLARRRLGLAAERRMHLEQLARLTNRPALAGAGEPIVVERPMLGSGMLTNGDSGIASRPEVRAMEAGIAMSDAEIAMAKRDYLPDFMIGAGIMDMMAPGPAMPLADLDDRFAIEIGVVIPLQRGRRDAALEEARLRQSQYEARLEAVRTEIQTETNDLQNRLREDLNALALYDDALMPQAETTLEATLSAYTTGRTEFLDLLDAQRMLFDLSMDYEETYADYMRTRARLERVLGSESVESSPVSMNPSAGEPAQD